MKRVSEKMSSCSLGASLIRLPVLIILLLALGVLGPETSCVEKLSVFF